MCARETVCACVCILSVSLKREPKPWQWLKLEAKIGIPPQPKTLTHTALYKPSKKWTKLFSTVPCEHYLLGYISSKICLFLLHKSPWKVLSSGWESMPRDTCSYSYMNVCINVYVFIYICNYVILAVNHESLCWFESFHSVQRFWLCSLFTFFFQIQISNMYSMFCVSRASWYDRRRIMWTTAETIGWYDRKWIVNW